MKEAANSLPLAIRGLIPASPAVGAVLGRPGPDKSGWSAGLDAGGAATSRLHSLPLALPIGAARRVAQQAQNLGGEKVHAGNGDCGIASPAANGVEFVDVQIADFAVRLGHVIPLFVSVGWDFPRPW